jgi:hypothetical protein
MVPDVEVRLWANGQLFSAKPAWTDDTWLNGPLVRECRSVVGFLPLAREPVNYAPASDNWGGKQEKWFFAPVTRTWYYVLPNGDLYRWDKTSERLDGFFLRNLGAQAWSDPAEAARAIAGDPVPSLLVIFDTQVFNDHSARVRVTVDNTLDVAGATHVDYDTIDVLVAGQNVYHHDQAEWQRTVLDPLAAQNSGRWGVMARVGKLRQYYLTRWTKVFPVSLTESKVTPDFEPFYQAKALPRFRPDVANLPYTPDGPRFQILFCGDLDPWMYNCGDRFELSPVPDTTASYLVYKTQDQRHYALANGDLSGSWPIHVRDPQGGIGACQLVSIDQRPNYWLDDRAEDKPLGGPLPETPYSYATPGPDRCPLTPENAHQPSLAYVPYLLTGDRYYAEEMAHWANFTLLATRPTSGSWNRGSQGLLSVNESRGFGWGLRNLVDAAAYLPDGDAAKAYFAEKVRNNLAWLDQYAGEGKGPLGVAWLDQSGLDPDLKKICTALWSHAYLAWAVDHANLQGFVGGTVWRDQIGNLQLALFQTPGYDRHIACPYHLPIGDPDGHLYTSLPEVYAAFGYGETYQWPADWFSSYTLEAWMLLTIAVRLGRPGAQEARDYVWAWVPGYIRERAGFAIAE